ncbi:MAG: amidase family protein [Cyclobacteriaceae bacterium]
MKIFYVTALSFVFACTPQTKTVIPKWEPYDESAEIEANADHERTRLRYKLIQSQVLDKNEIWKNVAEQIAYFSEEDYQRLKPLILDQDILTLQSHIEAGKLSYEKLTQWYLYRIVKFENDSTKYLNSILAINPNAVNEAREKDRNRSENDHPIYGMPVLLKDNINSEIASTTAGAHVLLNNKTRDAFIVERIKANGGIILGKTSLSEWANFNCSGCPNGFSAVGGQTLNPYGRRQFDTGGSSSGSGAAMATNYAAAAVGTETSGSILSPSSSSSLAGLKPTVGLLSRGGIVPISSTLDTPGPMTRNVTDNAILLSAMSGEDPADPATKDNPKDKTYWDDLQTGTLDGVRFGVNKDYASDSIYMLTVEKIVAMGGIAIEFQPIQVDFNGFGDLLSADMQIDLPNYLNDYGSDQIVPRTVEEIVAYNEQDSVTRTPYGHARFEGMLSVQLSEEELIQLRERLNTEGVRYFETPMADLQLDVVLGINNRGAGFAAAARYPCLTVPMGYRETGQPAGITFIGRPFKEDQLLKFGYAFEQETKMRKSPSGYE